MRVTDHMPKASQVTDGAASSPCSGFVGFLAASDVAPKQAMALAENRFRPGFHVAFDAWRATSPETNPNAPRGPIYMPQYRQPGLRKAAAQLMQLPGPA